MGGVKNVQKENIKKEAPRTPHSKKPSVYDMPLKMEETAAPRTPGSTASKEFSKSVRSTGSKAGLRSETSLGYLVDEEMRDLGALKEMQEQLRKKYIEFASELNSSFLKEIRNIQRPAPETVKILELFCGLVCVA